MREHAAVLLDRSELCCGFCNETMNTYDGEGCGENHGEQGQRQGCVRVLVEGEFSVEGAELTLEAEKLATSLKLAYLSSGTLPLSTLVAAYRLLLLCTLAKPRGQR